jgi:hypothetical protein
MLRFLERRGEDRKLRLFACACCRLAGRYGNVGGLDCVGLAEEVAEGRRTPAEAQRLVSGMPRLMSDDWAATADIGRLAHLFGDRARIWDGVPRAALVRCVFGNPFRPPRVEPSWLSWGGGTIAHLAQAAYEQRAMPSGLLDPARLAVLADALEESGCTDAALLAHLRGPGPHVRGCAAVELLLGRG